MLDIPYEIWEETYKRNIRPLPIWWSSEENKRKEYEAFSKFCVTGKVDKKYYDKS